MLAAAYTFFFLITWITNGDSFTAVYIFKKTKLYLFLLLFLHYFFPFVVFRIVCFNMRAINSFSVISDYMFSKQDQSVLHILSHFSIFFSLLLEAGVNGMVSSGAHPNCQVCVYYLQYFSFWFAYICDLLLSGLYFLPYAFAYYISIYIFWVYIFLS